MYNLFHYKKLARGKKETTQENKKLERSLPRLTSSGEIRLLNLTSSGASNSLFLGYMLYLISQSSHISWMCIEKIQTFLLLFV